MSEFTNHNFGVVGRCIYCGSTKDLSDEHIIPYGLGGKSVLEKASCKRCASITSQFEKEVLRETYFEFRNSMNFPTRNKQNRPESILINVETNDGEIKELTIPSQEHPGFLPMIEFEEPGILVGRDDNTLQVIGASLHGDRERIEKFCNKYNIKKITCSAPYSHSFARLLAKAALGYTIGCHSIENLEQNYVVPYILDRKKEGISKYVGTAKDKIIDGNKIDHRAIFAYNQNGEILIRMKLFASYDTPEYLVIAGKLKKAAWSSICLSQG